MISGVTDSSLASDRLLVLPFLDLSLPFLLRGCASSEEFWSLTRLSLNLIRHWAWVFSGSTCFSGLANTLSSPEPSSSLVLCFLGVSTGDSEHLLVGPVDLPSSAWLTKLHNPTDLQQLLHLRRKIINNEPFCNLQKSFIFCLFIDHDRGHIYLRYAPSPFDHPLNVSKADVIWTVEMSCVECSFPNSSPSTPYTRKSMWN